LKTYLSFFGRKLNLASRERRRWLVVIFYIVAAMIICAGWRQRGNEREGSVNVILFIFLAGSFLGGYWFWYGTRFEGNSLVKPFEGNQMLKSSLFSGAKRSDLRNDERDLMRRDHAHYQAYGILAGILMLAFILYNGPVYHSVSLEAQRRFVFLLLQAGVTLAFTLPAAIILWTEPDLIAEPDHKAAPTGTAQ